MMPKTSSSMGKVNGTEEADLVYSSLNDKIAQPLSSMMLKHSNNAT